MEAVWIGAAGIYVEMFLASIATFIWWFTEEGTAINDLSLNMMFLNAVSTVLVNGNPLLRFDGYYILMDALEIRIFGKEHRSSEGLSENLPGVGITGRSILANSWAVLFGAFTVASVIYRWLSCFRSVGLSSKFWNPTVSRQLVEW